MNLNMVIEQVGRDRGIERGILIETLEAALKTAAKRVFGEQRDIEAQYNEDRGDIELFLIITVADDLENPYREIGVEDARAYIDPNAEVGDELLFQIFYRDEEQDKAKEQDRRYGKLLGLESSRRTFGRIAAQTAKQVIIQRVREAERQNIYEEYKDRKNELITGIVRRFEKGNIIVDLGRADAVLPSGEQTRRESYRPGDRIQGYVKDVVRSARDAQVILSRTDPGLVIKLFEQEVPEIYEGIVKIVAVAREPGVRSKVAVYSTDSDVDPVGACVGMRGSRVQSVVQELRGEKIDIVPYHSDPARFVCNAISARRRSRRCSSTTRRLSMELIVPDDQLSLAIGRGGQNVRLAAQLTGWNLEIYSESRLRQLMAGGQEAAARVRRRDRWADRHALQRLVTPSSRTSRSPIVAELAQLPGFNEEKAPMIVDAATSIVSPPEEGRPAGHRRGPRARGAHGGSRYRRQDGRRHPRRGLHEARCTSSSRTTPSASLRSLTLTTRRRSRSLPLPRSGTSSRTSPRMSSKSTRRSARSGTRRCSLARLAEKAGKANSPDGDEGDEADEAGEAEAGDENRRRRD